MLKGFIEVVSGVLYEVENIHMQALIIHRLQGGSVKQEIAAIKSK